MGYLTDYEHDIFVSYAHSELNDWCKRLVKDVRDYVALGLKLRQASQVDMWMDYKICGSQPLTGQLKDKVERSGVLLVLMSEWYLESSWCGDEIHWFLDTVRQKRSRRPVFVVRVRPTDHATWPPAIKDERGHPLVGYDFVRAGEDNELGLPKGHPRPEDANDSRDYFAELSKLASDIRAELEALAQPSPPIVVAGPRRSPGLAEEPPQPERIFLAAAPAEDVDDLRDELVSLLQAEGRVVVPEANVIDGDDVHELAPEWIKGCDRFVQVLGSASGAWRYDDAGFVMYQHELARKADKPIFVYRAPTLELSRVRKPEYRQFIERFQQDEVGDLPNFVKQVTRPAPPVQGGNRGPRSVFMMASPRDESLEREIRRMLAELNIRVFPLARWMSDGRELATVLHEGSSFLNVVKRCGAILLINGNVKQEDGLWIEDRLLDIEYDIEQQLGGHLPCAIVDAPPDPRLQPWEDVCVFPCDSPTLRRDLQGWLGALQGGARAIGEQAA